jgi:hypothetical protein
MKYLKSFSQLYDEIVINCQDIFIDNSVNNIGFYFSYINSNSTLVLVMESLTRYFDTIGDFIDNIFRTVTMIEKMTSSKYLRGEALFSAYVDMGTRTPFELDFEDGSIDFKFGDGDVIRMLPGKMAIKEIRLYFSL